MTSAWSRGVQFLGVVALGIAGAAAGCGGGGHGLRGRRSRSGAVSFDVLSTEAAHAPVQ